MDVLQVVKFTCVIYKFCYWTVSLLRRVVKGRLSQLQIDNKSPCKTVKLLELRQLCKLSNLYFNLFESFFVV